MDLPLDPIWRSDLLIIMEIGSDLADGPLCFPTWKTLGPSAFFYFRYFIILFDDYSIGQSVKLIKLFKKNKKIKLKTNKKVCILYMKDINM